MKKLLSIAVMLTFGQLTILLSAQKTQNDPDSPVSPELPVLSAQKTQTKPDEIWDKAYYDVVGKVKSITYDNAYTIKFDTKGRSLSKNLRKIKKHGTKTTYSSNNPNPTSEEDFTEATYDANHKLIKLYLYERYISKITYDKQNRITSLTEVCEATKYITTYTYDEQGFRTTETVKGYDPDNSKEGYSKTPSDTRKTTYVVLDHDQHGNWTKRKDNTGNIEIRKIEYYQ